MSQNDNCIFCQIAKGEKGDLVYQNNSFVVVNDINPKAKIHLLLVPKKHITSLNEVSDTDKELLGELLLLAKEMANKQQLKNGYRIIINNGSDAGQTVDHLHMHLLGGENLGE